MPLLDRVVGIASTAGLYLFYGVSLIIIYNTLLAIYNVFFHPLRHFPGPLLHRASKVPWALANIRGTKPFLYQSLHENYGPVVRVAPDFLDFTDARAWKDIFGHSSSPSGQGEMPKARVFYNATGEPDNLVNAAPAEHARLRRALAYGFSAKALREQEVMITRHVDHLMNILHEHSSDAAKGNKGKAALVEMDKHFAWVTFDIIGELVFGQDFGSLASRAHSRLFALVLHTVAAISFLGSLNYLGLGFIVTLLTKFGGANEAYDAVLEDIGKRLEKRMAAGEEKPDLIGGLLKIPEEELGFLKLRSNSMLLAVAGSETTATSLAGATYFLLKNPEKMEVLKKEIRGNFKRVEEINMQAVSTLEYLNAVINESLRCYPPVAGGIVRIVQGNGGTIAGRFVPPGTLVEINNWSANYSRENWSDAWSFQPERFLASSKKQNTKDNFDSLQPFSYGPRNCIGQNIGLAEIRLILSRLIFSFDMKLGPGTDDWMDRQVAHSIWLKPSLPVYLTPVTGNS